MPAPLSVDLIVGTLFSISNIKLELEPIVNPESVLIFKGAFVVVVVPSVVKKLLAEIV